MKKTASLEAREAKYGEKMIEIKVRFWTNDIAGSDNEIRPKHAWSSGIIRVKLNKAHGIPTGKARNFQSLLDIGKVMEQVLKESGVVLHISNGMKRYMSAEEPNRAKRAKQ